MHLPWKRIKWLAGLVVLVALPALGQPSTQLPITPFSLSLLKAASSNEAQVILGLAPTNTVGVTNWFSELSGNALAAVVGTSNALDILPGGMTLNTELVPNPYYLTYQFQNATGAKEDMLQAAIDFQARYGVPYGQNIVQLDTDWQWRNGSGDLVLDPQLFTHDGAYWCAYAHQRGVKLVFFLNANGANFNTTNTTTSIGYEARDVWQLATNFLADGFKMDGENFKIPQTALLTTRPMFRAVSYGEIPYPGAPYDFNPRVPAYFNAAYVCNVAGDTIGDPISGYSYDNVYQHLLSEMNLSSYVRPGFYGEGVGWMQGNLPTIARFSDQACAAPQNVSLELSAILPSRPMLNGWVITNLEYLAILRDPLVLPGKVVKVASSGAPTNAYGYWPSNYTFVRQLGPAADGLRAVCFLNSSLSTQSMTVTVGDLGFGTNTAFTVSSPWYHTYEAWATNSWAVSVPPTNSRLFKVRSGLVYPTFTDGTNYLSDQPYMSGTTGAALDSIIRDKQTNPGDLYIGTTNYAKGFCIGQPYNIDTSTWADTDVGFALGGQCETFVADFGKLQAWEATTTHVGWRLTIYLDGAQAYQSGYITNYTQGVHISLAVTGKNAIRFNVHHSSWNGVEGGTACLGNAYVTKPKTGIYRGNFTGDGSGLTGLASSPCVVTIPMNTPEVKISGTATLSSDFGIYSQKVTNSWLNLYQRIPFGWGFTNADVYITTRQTNASGTAVEFMITPIDTAVGDIAANAIAIRETNLLVTTPQTFTNSIAWGPIDKPGRAVRVQISGHDPTWGVTNNLWIQDVTIKMR